MPPLGTAPSEAPGAGGGGADPWGASFGRADAGQILACGGRVEEGFASRVSQGWRGAAARGDPRRESRASPHAKTSLGAIVKSFSPVLTSAPLLALLTPPLRTISLEEHHLSPIVLTLARGSLRNTASHPARGCDDGRR